MNSNYKCLLRLVCKNFSINMIFTPADFDLCLNNIHTITWYLEKDFEFISSDNIEDIIRYNNMTAQLYQCNTFLDKHSP